MRFKLNEDWMDGETGERVRDFTGTVKNPPHDVFDVTQTDCGMDGLLPNSPENDYYKNNKNLVGKIVYMTPMQYFESCAYDIFQSGNSPEDLIKGRRRDKDKIERIQRALFKYHRQLPITYLNYANQGQEGMHRMVVVGDAFGWDTKFPVLVIDWFDRKAEVRREIKKYLQKACDEVVQYHYRDYDDFLVQVQDEINKAFEYTDYFDEQATNGEMPFTIEDNGDAYIIKVLNVPCAIKKSDIDYRQADTDEEKPLSDWDDNDWENYLSDNIDVDDLEDEVFLKDNENIVNHFLKK